MPDIDHAGREDDIADLEMLRKITVEGRTASEIAQARNVSRNVVIGRLNRIRKADLEKSGECPDLVRSLYKKDACSVDSRHAHYR